MARISYTVYKTSALATVLSAASGVIGTGGFVVGALGLISFQISAILGGVVLFAAGIGAGLLADVLGANSWWKKVVVAQNLEPHIRNSVDFCFQVYNANPNDIILNKIEALNPQGAAQLRSVLQAQNQKKS